jgi:hypothetical protein
MTSLLSSEQTARTVKPSDEQVQIKDSRWGKIEFPAAVRAPQTFPEDEWEFALPLISKHAAKKTLRAAEIYTCERKEGGGGIVCYE